MKSIYSIVFFSFVMFCFSEQLKAQCTPDTCLSSLPPIGGICNSTLIVGRVNELYHDKISFHITNACMDMGELDPQYAGMGGRLLKLHTFSFSGMPAGITGATNQPEYFPPNNGCGGLNGIPLEAGVFNVTIHILANIRVWPFSTSCSGIIYTNNNDQPFNGTTSLTILPDASFSGLSPVYNTNSPSSVLTPTGTQGGYFTGPGVTGNIFDPSAAGAGIHEIKYIVTAQEGVAVAPATDSTSQFAEVLSPDKTLNLTVLLEGLYDGNHTMRKAMEVDTVNWIYIEKFGGDTADIITVELWTDTGIMVFSDETGLSTTGAVTLTVDGTISGNCYIYVRHRNSIPVSTSQPVSFSGTSITYNFTTSASQAYFDNQQQLEAGVYGLFAGDVDQDETIGALDMVGVDNAARNFVEGYFPEDINGDAEVGAFDIIFIDNNSRSFVSGYLPF